MVVTSYERPRTHVAGEESLALHKVTVAAPEGFTPSQ